MDHARCVYILFNIFLRATRVVTCGGPYTYHKYRKHVAIYPPPAAALSLTSVRGLRCHVFGTPGMKCSREHVSVCPHTQSLSRLQLSSVVPFLGGVWRLGEHSSQCWLKYCMVAVHTCFCLLSGAQQDVPRSYRMLNTSCSTRRSPLVLQGLARPDGVIWGRTVSDDRSGASDNFEASNRMGREEF